MTGQSATAPRLRLGAKSIGEYLGIEDPAKVHRLLRQGLVPGAFKLGRQHALDEATSAELIRSKAKGA